MVVAGVVVAVVLAGVVARWLILRSSLGALNADEAYTGVQAFEILDGHLPVVIGGTVYTAVVESYVYAPIAALFGADILHLKLVAVAFWAIAALVVLAIGSELAGRRAGAIAAALVWITPGALLTVSTNAYESYGSGMATTVVAFYLSRRLCDGPAPSWRGPTAVGIVAGLGFWMHPMYLTTLVPMLSVVLWVHRRRLVVWTGIVVGGVVGCAPFLLWNARNGWPSLDDRPEAAGSYADRLRTFVTDLLPRSLGLRDSQLEWMLGPALGITLYGLFLVAVVVGLVVQYRRSRRPSRVLLPVVVRRRPAADGLVLSAHLRAGREIRHHRLSLPRPQRRDRDRRAGPPDPPCRCRGRASGRRAHLGRRIPRTPPRTGARRDRRQPQRRHRRGRRPAAAIGDRVRLRQLLAGPSGRVRRRRHHRGR